MQRIDYEAIDRKGRKESRIAAANEAALDVDYICITDAYANLERGGQEILEILARRELESIQTGRVDRFKIRVLRDEWGNTPPELRVVEREIMRPLKTPGKKNLTLKQIGRMKRRGTFKRNYIIRRTFDIDSDGCIDCTYSDASYFLSQYGVHFDPGIDEPITGRKEISGGQCKSPDGSMRHVWYWRYAEVPPWMQKKGKKDK